MIPLVVEDCTINLKNCMYEVIDYAESEANNTELYVRKKEADGKKLLLR